MSNKIQKSQKNLINSQKITFFFNNKKNKKINFLNITLFCWKKANISFNILGDMEMHKWLWKCITEANVMENIK